MSKCKHCGMDIVIRNPSGYCDHLYYPDNCQICQKMTNSIPEKWEKRFEEKFNPTFDIMKKEYPTAIPSLKKGLKFYISQELAEVRSQAYHEGFVAGRGA